jgi:hypothetical protein
LWISSYSNTQKIENILANPNISISVDISDEDEHTKAVILEGKAELVREPREFLVQKFYWIYERYLGKEGAKAKDPQSWINDPHNLLIRLEPEKIITWDW